MSTELGGTGSENPTANTTSVLRIMNERAVYERIRVLGPVSRPQLAAATGLSKPTISLALADLERAGLVVSAGHRTGQRRARRAAVRDPARGRLGDRARRRPRVDPRRARRPERRDRRTRGRPGSRADSATALIGRLGRIVDDLAAAADGDDHQHRPRHPGRARRREPPPAARAEPPRLGPPRRDRPARRAAPGPVRDRERHRARRAGRAGVRPRRGAAALRLRLDRHRHRHGDHRGRRALPRRARRGR